MNTLAILVATVGIVGLSLFLGKMLPIHLPRASQIFDRKPFNCRPCFTFHLVWIGMGAFSLQQSNYKLFVGGLLLAFMIYGIVRYIDNKQIIE